MRTVVLLCAALLFSSAAAVAQNDISSVAAPSPAAALPASPQFGSRANLTDWQITFGYQFNRFNMPLRKVGINTLPAFTVNDNGFDVSFTRFFRSWVGLEAEAAAGFGGSGTAPQIASAKSIFAGGGPRFARRGHGRYEPWFHALIGLEHFRFTQTATAYGSNSSLAFMAGGGVDIHLNQRTAFRFQFDYLGTDLFSLAQTNWQTGAGIVFNF
jgi:hypothetical protein